jgi:hypothetical protein
LKPLLDVSADAAAAAAELVYFVGQGRCRNSLLYFFGCCQRQ